MDVDWDDVAPRGALVPHDASGREVAGDQGPSDEVGVIVHLPKPKRSQQFLPANCSHPLRRSPCQHKLVAARMREIKAMKGRDRWKNQAKGVLQVAFAKLRAVGVRMSGRARAVVRADNMRLECLTDAGVRRLPLRAMLDVAFPSISMRNAVARAHCMRPQTVTECWCAVATALVAVYINMISGLRGLVEAKQIKLHIFGSALGFDESKQCLALPLSSRLAYPDHSLVVERVEWHPAFHVGRQRRG